MKKVGIVKKKINNREVRLKILMLKAGLKQKDIAESTGYTYHMVSKYIKGTRRSKRINEFFEKLRIKLGENENAKLSGS
ncbi:hypothetical protein ES703_26267 [subsurface metagenome]